MFKTATEQANFFRELWFHIHEIECYMERHQGFIDWLTMDKYLSSLRLYGEEAFVVGKEIALQYLES